MFTGFSEKTIEFLWGIRFNNEKPWFEEHKEEYLTHLYRPMMELGRDVHQALCDRFPNCGLNLHVCRIYRDARRLHGRGPYKDHLWFTLREEDERWAQTPVFWFEIGPEGYNYGLGCYSCTAERMERFRRHMDADPASMEKLTRQLQKQERFRLEGPEYARKKPAASELLSPWYQKKCFALTCDRPHDELETSSALTAELVDAFCWLKPFYDHFRKLDKQAD